MSEGKARRRIPRAKVQTEDGIQKPEPGEIANMLHMDMTAHRKKTAEFNEGWKRALCYASTGLAFVSMLKAVEKAREGSPAWMERGITSANAGLTAVWVAQVDGQDQKSSVLPSQIAALSLSLYQMLSWWTSRQGGEHVDFPVAVILFVVAVAAIASMRSTLNAADSAFRASGVLAEKVSTRRNNKG